MVFAKVMAIISCLVYMSIEVVVTYRKAAFVIFEFTLGVAYGAANTFRTHIAMASTEKDRPRAIGISSLAPAIGLLIGPMIQLIFTSIAYPGLPFLFGTHINLFTAPIVPAIFISLVALFLLIFQFDGRMRVNSNGSANQTSTSLNAPDLIKDGSKVEKWSHKFDLVAVGVCLITRVVLTVSLINFLTVCPPYIQKVFRLSERKAVVGALFILLGAYLITYPWWFIGGSISYQDPREGIIYLVYEEPLGCPDRFKWCSTTPAVNMPIFLGSLILSLGIAVPLSQINLDILYSKVLGKIKQGTMQSLFVVIVDVLAITMPILFSEIYMATGPKYIWLIEISLICFCAITWITFYSRMISNTAQNQQIE